MSDIRAFRDKCYKAATSLQQASKDAVFAVAMLAKVHQLEAARAAGVGERLRGVGRKGAKVGVGFEIKGFANPTALVKWRGPVHLVNNPTKAHEIAHRKKSHALKLPDGFADHVPLHPGTAGKHFFETGVELTKAQAGTVAQREIHRSLARHFTGG